MQEKKSRIWQTQLDQRRELSFAKTGYPTSGGGQTQEIAIADQLKEKIEELEMMS
jgi:hypothetical protein